MRQRKSMKIPSKKYVIFHDEDLAQFGGLYIPEEIKKKKKTSSIKLSKIFQKRS